MEKYAIIEPGRTPEEDIPVGEKRAGDRFDHVVNRLAEQARNNTGASVKSAEKPKNQR